MIDKQKDKRKREIERGTLGNRKKEGQQRERGLERERQLERQTDRQTEL